MALPDVTPADKKEWPLGCPVWVWWGVMGWRPAQVMQYTAKFVVFKLLDGYGSVAGGKAIPKRLRHRVSNKRPTERLGT